MLTPGWYLAMFDDCLQPVFVFRIVDGVAVCAVITHRPGYDLPVFIYQRRPVADLAGMHLFSQTNDLAEHEAEMDQLLKQYRIGE